MMRAIINMVQNAWLLILRSLDPELGGQFLPRQHGREGVGCARESVSC